MSTNTIVTYVGNGAQTDFAFSFDYLRKEFVRVIVDGIVTPFTFHTAQTLRITPAPLTGQVVVIRRVTDRTRLVDFVDGSILIATDLNVSALQAIHIAAEALDAASGSLLIDETGAYSAGFRRISQVGNPTAARDAVTKEFVETGMTSQLTLATTEKTEAVAARVASETARDGSVAARTGSETARNGAVTARTGSETARTGSEAARDAAIVARNATTAARDVTVVARDEAVVARDGAVSALNAVTVDGATPQSRVIGTGSGLTGGGNLSANRTISVDSTVVRTTDTGVMRLNQAQTVTGTKTFSAPLHIGTGGTAQTPSLTFFSAGHAGWNIDAISGALRFFKDGSVRQQILSNGRVYFGGAASRGGSGHPIACANDTVGNVLRESGYLEWITDAGPVGTNYFVSDERKKENIKPSLKNSSAIIQAIDFISFDWKPDQADAGHVEVGVSAQQLQRVDPALVAELSDGSLMVREPALITHIAKALQEAMAEIASLKSRLDALETSP